MSPLRRGPASTAAKSRLTWAGMACVYPFSTISPCAVPAEVELALTSRRITVRIRVRGTECRLLGPAVPELKHLLDKPSLGPGRLILELEQAGVCLSPSDEDAAKIVVPRGPGKTGNTAVIRGARCDGNAGAATTGDEAKNIWTLKDRVLEDTLCREVAAVAAAFELRSSRWNAGVGSARSVFEVRETCAFTGGESDYIDFKTALVELDEVSESALNAPGVGAPPCPVKCALVNGGHDTTSSVRGARDEAMDLIRFPGEDTHAYMLKCLESSSSPEAVKRARDSCCRFQKTLAQVGNKLPRIMSSVDGRSHEFFVLHCKDRGDFVPSLLNAPGLEARASLRFSRPSTGIIIVGSSGTGRRE